MGTVDVVITSVSTHSRPKAAGIFPDTADSDYLVSTHSRPKAAGVVKTVLKHF